jgi:nucleoside 2-deoxyribosyltransferase
MKVYIATKFSLGKLHASRLAEFLEGKGHEVTCKWWDIQQAPPAERTEDESKDTGRQEMCGVVGADVVVVYLTDPDYAYKGTLFELGAAFGSGRRVIVVAPCEASNKTFVVFRVPAVSTFNTIRCQLTSGEREDWSNSYMPLVVALDALRSEPTNMP